MRKHIIVASLILLCLTLPQGLALAVPMSQISQHDITWTFDREYECGQFANGDWWVVPDTPQGTVTIVSISPAPVGGRNGWEINPSITVWQPYDDRWAFVRRPGQYYDASLQPPLPAPVSVNSSILSTISISDDTQTECFEDGPNLWGWYTYDRSSCALSILRSAAVLTVLGEVPPNNGATVFRPPYIGTNKPLYSAANLRDDLLLSLPPVGTPPSMAEAERMFERVWIDHIPDWGGRTLHPTDNMRSNFGAGMARDVGVGALRLLLDDPIENKQTLLIRYVQLGIDLYGLLENGMYWQANGGHMSGRKLPILFAGLMLDHQGMLGIGSLNLPYMGFQEDCQTYYDNDPDYEFFCGVLGFPRWGLRHCWDTDTEPDCNESNRYRFHSTSVAWVAQTLAARLLELQDEWNHPAYFDYMDRWMTEDSDYMSIHGSRWANDMWEEYRYFDFGNPQADAGVNQVVTDSDDNGSEEVSLDGSGSSDSDGTIVSYVWSESGNQIATGSTATVTLPIGEYIITLTVTDNDALTDSDTVVIRVEGPDETPPYILSVRASETEVVIVFNEELNPVSAEQISNYSINNGISVIAAFLNTEMVTLTVSNQAEGSYTLTIANVADISGNTMAQTQVDYQYTEGLVGHWAFDETSGIVALDGSGSGNDGLLIDNPVWTTGIIGGAISLDGIADAIEIGTNNFDAAQGTISLWAYAESFLNSNYLFGHTTEPAWANRIQLYTDVAGNLGLGLGNSHSTQTSIQTLTLQTWYHIAFSWDGANYIVYVDGQNLASGIYTGLSSLNTFADIGNDGNRFDRTEPFNGRIDEVRIYNRPLTAQEVLDLYNAGAVPFIYGDVSEDGIISAYDAALAAMAAVGLVTLTDEQITRADVTGNGDVSATDAAWIARKVANPALEFPVEQP